MACWRLRRKEKANPTASPFRRLGLLPSLDSLLELRQLVFQQPLKVCLSVVAVGMFYHKWTDGHYVYLRRADHSFPPWEEPTRISVRINRDLLKVIDPSMVPLEEGDSFSRVGRKGKAAINQMTRDVSSALFGPGAEVTKLDMGFGWMVLK